jgi:DNA polymerase I-like protein with 3'-5' exonuclease and polymerase domains
MIVRTIAHAKLVKARIESRWKKTGRKYFCPDTETEALDGYPKEDALVIGRARCVFWSLCYQGEAYSFPTSYFRPNFPQPEEWMSVFQDWFTDPTIIKVQHNANYDMNIFHYSFEQSYVPNIWCTSIGCWKASEYREKGLKDRAPRYGRYWRETKTVDWTKLDEVADYAEQDVVQTDELFQMQYYGAVYREHKVTYIGPDGKLFSLKIHLPAGKLVIPDERLSAFDKAWVKYQELPVLRATIRAERRGFPVDVFKIRDIRVVLNKELQTILKTMYRMAGRVLNLNSGKQLEEACLELGIINPHRTEKGAMQFDAKAMQKLRGVHPFLDNLSKYRALEKMATVYIGRQNLDTDNYPKSDAGMEYYVSLNDGALHCTLSTVGAVTGRHSSSNPNMQNIPARKDTFGMKECFVATPRGTHLISGRVLPKRYRRKKLLIVLDYAQLEIRVMALLCKDRRMTKVLRDRNGDIHTETANQFGVSRDPYAKNLNFLLLYGGMAYMLSQSLTFFGAPTSQGQAQAFIDKHRIVYPRVPEYREELLEEHEKNGFVKLFMGRRRTLLDVDWSNEKQRHKAETTLSNNVVQGSGQDFLKAAIVRADYSCINPDREILNKLVLPSEHRNYLKDKAAKVEKIRKVLKQSECRYLLQVHDEVIYSVLPEAAEECMSILADVMSWKHYFPSISDYNVPLVAEGGVGETWKQAKSKDKHLYHVIAGYDEFEKYSK